MNPNSISTQYRFADFTLQNYINLLNRAKNLYSFQFFSDDIPPGSIILRHDLDISISHAHKIAAIEESLGIKSTYFIQLHSEFYNPFDKANFNFIKNMLSMGHEIGLHFDTHFWGIKSEERLEECVLFDKLILEKMFGVKINVFSFHNNEFTLNCTKPRVAGLINVYSDYFKNEIGYCSDSLGYWRIDNLNEILTEPLKFDKLQVLIHPCWWRDEVLAPRQRIFKLLDMNHVHLKKLWDDTLKEFNTKNVDEEIIL